MTEPLRKKPSLFLVGAPKCGTTALDHYLGQHPDVFMARKESHHFARDVLVPYHLYYEREAYLSLFAGSGEKRILGDSSVFYLASKEAPQAIREFNQEARIIVMLRHPVTMMHSMHAQSIFNGDEDLLDLRAALAAECERSALLPLAERRPHLYVGLLYRHLAQYADQLDRFFQSFSRDRVKVILFDDFVRDTASMYREVLEFLGVDPAFRPEFRVVNASKAPRSRMLARFLASPPPILYRIRRALRIPPLIQQRVRGALLRLNAREERRPPADAELDRALTDELRPSVERLERLIGRDLSAWKEPPKERGPQGS